MGSKSTELTETAQLNQVYTALSSSRTRVMVSVLAGREVPMPLADLASDIAALEEDDDGRVPAADLVHRIYASLYHIHVPKLAAIDVVTYDADRNTVALNDTSESTGELLKMLSQLGTKPTKMHDANQFT